MLENSSPSLLEVALEPPLWQSTPPRTCAARPQVLVEHTLARVGAERLWRLLAERDHVPALGALTGGQAVQMAKAGLEAIYLSGWQVAADANLAGHPTRTRACTRPTASRARPPDRQRLLRAEQVAKVEGEERSCLLPIVADAEAGFGGPLNAYELTAALIEAGAAGIHFEDQLASEKKCGHLGGKVLVPTGQFIRTLQAARLAADVAGVPTILVARTDALAATLLTSDVDEQDRPFLTGERTAEGYFRVRAGLEADRRAIAYAPTPTCCGARPPPPTWTRPAGSPRPSTPSSRASCWPTTARPASTGGGRSTSRRSPGSRRSWPRWATGSSSSPWPASTA